MVINKAKFLKLHLMVSFCIALIVLILVFFIWYPFPLNIATGVTHIFLMMLGIDVVLGPFFTWLVYKEGKKTLKFDITIIILIQFSALFYGVYSIAQARPVWIVYNVDRFDLIQKNEIYITDAQKVNIMFREVSWFYPKYVAIKFASDAKQRTSDMFDEVLRGVDISQRPERYIELSKVTDQIEKRAKALTFLDQYNDKLLVQSILAKYPQANAFVPLKANAVDMTVLINKEKGEVVKIVDLRPWK